MTHTFCPIYTNAKRFPEKIAIAGEKTLTYAQLNAIVTNTQTKLDYEQGTRIAIREERSIEFISCLFAAWRNSLIVCPLNSKISSDYESEILQKQEARLLRLSSHSRSVDAKIELDLPCLMLMTSGSSGKPKMALFTYKNLFINADLTAFRLGLSERHRWQASLPLFHVGGIAVLLRVFLSGATLSLLDLDDQITHLSFVPTQLYRFLKQASFPSQLQMIMVGGAPLSQELYQEAIARKIPIAVSYGSTEMGSQVLLSTRPALLDHSFYLGTAQNPQQMKIDEYGEVLVKGPTLFCGYWEQGNLTLPLDKQGWFHTGDLAHFHPRYGFSIYGRKDHLIISGGENIQPEEIEKAIYRCQGVCIALVIGVNDLEYGQKVIAFVSSKKPLTSLKQELYEKLPRYKVPKEIYNLDECHFKGMKPSRSFLQEWAKKNLKNSLLGSQPGT